LTNRKEEKRKYCRDHSSSTWANLYKNAKLKAPKRGPPLPKKKETDSLPNGGVIIMDPNTKKDKKSSLYYPGRGKSSRLKKRAGLITDSLNSKNILFP